MKKVKCFKLERYVYDKEILKSMDKDWFENEFKSLTMKLIEFGKEEGFYLNGDENNSEVYWIKQENSLEIRRRIKQLTDVLLDKAFNK